jgi:hypothetical protein
MVSFYIETEAFEQFLVEVEQKISQNAYVAFSQAATEARDAQRAFHYQNRTGRLTSSMQVELAKLGEFRFRAVVVTGANYALWVDGPTKAHMIHAIRAKALRFYWRGQIYFRKWVMHPGTSGAGFSEHARQWFNVKATTRMQNWVDAAIRST